VNMREILHFTENAAHASGKICDSMMGVLSTVTPKESRGEEGTVRIVSRDRGIRRWM
jgi:hypothetical protein